MINCSELTVKMLRAHIVSAAALALCAACGRRPSTVLNVDRSNTGEPGVRVIPTLYRADRFFAAPVTTRGDSIVLLLDTGDNSRIWNAFASTAGLDVAHTSALAGAGRPPAKKPFAVSRLPSLAASTDVPGPALNDGLIEITPPIDKFDTLMSRRTVGQLGADWFANRVWTLDYPRRRLLLHDAALPAARDDEHETPLGFPVDSSGRRLGHVPRIGVVIDGDSLNMLFDTGATVWLTSAARARVDDAGDPERAVSLIWQSVFDRWRQRHPDWPVIDDADQVSGAPMIRVPNVRIAGFDTGPVWFRSLVGAKAAPPSRRPGVPLVRSVFVGTVGGNVLRTFAVTLDYPNATARFRRGESNGR